MPKQRMAGYVPLKGAPAETEPAPAPAQDTTTAAPASAAAAVPVAPTAPTSGLTPLSARRRMAGYVPFAREAEIAPATISAASAASWNWIDVNRRGVGKARPVPSAKVTSAMAVTMTMST